MKTKISSKGQVVLPADLRRLDDLRAGDELAVERVGEGEYVLRRVTVRPNRGLVDLLRTCPVHDWFEPFDRTATTDEAPIEELG